MHISTALLFSLHYDISTSLWHTLCTATYSLHYWTSLHFTFNSLNQSTRPYDNVIFSFQLTSLHLYLLHFTALIITFLTVCLKLNVLLVRAPICPSVSWFQSVMVLFTKEYMPTSFLWFLALISHLWSTLLKSLGALNLSFIVFHALSRYTLWTEHTCVISSYAAPSNPSPSLLCYAQI